MQTNRFETFMDAVLAIIITVLVLKLPQPSAATWAAVWDLNMRYLTYGICFLIIFNTWYTDHNLFQMVDKINNNVVLVYGAMLFAISLIPYFATWVTLHPESVPAQTMFGLMFLIINICYTLSTYLIIQANPYNEKLRSVDLRDFRLNLPIAILIIGFIATYTVYIPGIYVACILSTLCWFVSSLMRKSEVESSERFEAFFDAIVAIVLTVIVLEITMASEGSWQSLFALKLEFLAYAISFVVCFNFWNYNNNLFSIVNRVDGKVIWSVGAAMFLISLIPYLSLFVAEHFGSFVAQACYGLDFLAVVLLSIWTSHALLKVDPANIALRMALQDHLQLYSTIIVVGVAMGIGYFFYPPAIILSCLISIILVLVLAKL